MLRPVITKKFDRDLKRMLRRGKDGNKLNKIISTLLAQQPLESRNYDHKLSGSFEGHRECHIEPDWLLIYRVIPPILKLERTGTHADLFE